MDATHSSQRTILHFIYYLHFDLSKHRNCVMMPRSLGSQSRFCTHRISHRPFWLGMVLYFLYLLLRRMNPCALA